MPTRPPGSPTCPTGRSWRPTCAPCCDPATCASRSALATSPRCPTSWPSPAPLRDGHGVVMTAPDAVRAAADILGARARRDGPIGTLTTYRVGGRAALLTVAESEDDPRLLARA